ncbi:hypothetical protein D3C81_1782210 [compost metagenome]
MHALADLQFNAGTGFAVARDDPRQLRIGHRHHGGHDAAAALLVGDLAHVLERNPQVRQNAVGQRHELQACRRRFDSARGAVEQFHPQRLFHPLHRPGQRGLGDVQRQRRRDEAAALGHHADRLQLAGTQVGKRDHRWMPLSWMTDAPNGIISSAVRLPA